MHVYLQVYCDHVVVACIVGGHLFQELMSVGRAVVAPRYALDATPVIG